MTTGAATCGQCDAPLPAGALFCDACGAVVETRSIPPASCPDCGTATARGTSFCDACGESLADRRPRRRSVLAGSGLLFLGAALLAVPLLVDRSPAGVPWPEGNEVIVQLEPDADITTVLERDGQPGKATLVARGSNTYRVSLDSGDPVAAARNLLADPSVLRAIPPTTALPG